MLTCVEHKPCKKNEGDEEIWHEKHRVQKVLGEVSDVDTEESCNRRCHDQAVYNSPKDIRGILHVVEFEDLEISLEPYRVRSQPNWNPKRKKVADYFLKEPDIFPVKTVLDFLQYHPAFVDHREARIHYHRKIRVGDNE